MKLKARFLAVSLTVVAAAGCHQQKPVHTMPPATEPTMAPARLASDEAPPASQPTTPPAPSADTLIAPKPHGNPAGVVEKPFIALPKFAGADKPSVLLLAHARGDSPVPLSEYAKQKSFTLADFHLRRSLSLYDVQTRLGLPAQWADYSELWVVYRLNAGKELWMHFAGPTNNHLLAADVVGAAENGYSRQRVFPTAD